MSPVVVVVALASAAAPSLTDTSRSVLLRAAVVAGRATVVLSMSRQATPIDLRATRCDGPGRVWVACADLTEPFEQTHLSHPASVIRRNRPLYPGTLLRHSHSRYGLYVAEYGSPFNYADETTWFAGVTLPRLEYANRGQPGVQGVFDPTAWNSLWSHYRSGGITTPEPNPFAGPAVPPPPSDFLVTAAAECELFLAQPSGAVECHARSVLPSRQPPKNVDVAGLGKPWDKRYRVPAGVTGPFAVVPHGQARYLVTPAGAVVRICDAAGKPLGKAATVYDKSPVRAVVHDADEDRRYAFTASH